MATPGIPNEYTLSTTCFGNRLASIQDQIFAAVGMGFRRLELGLTETPPSMDGLDDSCRETGVTIPSLVAGCRDPLNGKMAVERLGSLDEDECDRALNSVRRHVRLARTWGCRTVVVRGSKIEDLALRAEAKMIEARTLTCSEDNWPELADDVQDFVHRAQASSQRQIEQYCRSLHALMKEDADVFFAVEPGRDIDDLLGYEAVGWVLDDLPAERLGYWHDVGRIHMREQMSLPPQGKWLESFGSRMVGIHLQDAAQDETEMPLGLGEVDFKLVAEFTPKSAERVLDIAPRHGRAEILSSVQFLRDHGF